jgi:pimeloyl-ACP methyl ester carboxylesterase
VTDYRRIAQAVSATAALLAVGAAAGVAAERTVVAKSHRADSEVDEPFGRLRGAPVMVTDSLGGRIYAEVEECTRPDPQNLTLVFSHGYALNQDCWHYQRRDLNAQGRLVFWDQRSHGRSARSKAESNTIEQEGEDLFNVITQVVPEGPIILIGHSMGGMATMAFALSHPDLFRERVRGVALLSTSSDLNELTLGLPKPAARVAHRVVPMALPTVLRNAELVDHGRARVSDLALLVTRHYSFGPGASPALVDWLFRMNSATPIDVLAEFVPTLQGHEKRAALDILAEVPCLIMVGSEDRMTPMQHSVQMSERMPEARFEVVPDTGHMMLLERYPLVNARLRALVARVRAELTGAPSTPSAPDPA